MKKSTIYFQIFLIFLSSQLLGNNPDSTKINIFKLTEIPNQIEITSDYLVQQRNEFVSSSLVNIVKKNIESIERRFNRLNTDSDSISYIGSNLVQLENHQRRWGSLKSKVQETITSITSRNKELDREIVSLKELLFMWEETYQQKDIVDIPSDLANSIIVLNGKISELIKILDKEISTLLTSQILLTTKKNEVQAKLAEIQKIVLLKQQAVFDRNSESLWDQIADTTNSSPMEYQASKLVTSSVNYVNNFYNFYKRKLTIGILALLLFLVFTFGLKYYGSKIEDNDPIIHKALLLFNKPFAVALLLFLLFLSFGTENSASFQGMRRVLMLIPLLLILLKIMDSRLRKPLYIFFFLFFINEFRVSSADDNLLGHLLLLGLVLLTFFTVFWIKRGNLVSSFLKNQKLADFIKSVFTLAFILISLVLILNILGYIALSNILFNGFYDIIYATILFITANLVFNAIVLIVLRTKLMQKLKVVLYHSNKIISTSKNIIKVALSIGWIGIFLNSFKIYDFVYNAIGKILSTSIGYGSIAISLSEIIMFSLTIWISFQLSKFIRFLLEVDILPKIDLPRGVPGTITSITKYLVLSIGLLMALVSIGVDFDKFALMFGALGVGIGFGLQNVVNNFISGIILIFERPIQIGDLIKVGELYGTVRKIGIRTSIIRTFEGAEIIVPNGNLISNELTNLTLSDEQRRMDINVGVEYGSDVAKVSELLVKCALENDRVLKDPEPIVLFRNFGNSSLDFSLRCWTGSSQNWIISESELRFAINKAFEENNITIPFPQTDINFKNSLFIDKNDKKLNK